jgi:hypothetical protein
VTTLPHLLLKSADPFSLDDAVGLCFDKEQQPTKVLNPPLDWPATRARWCKRLD